MKIPKTILRGFDGYTEKIVAQALGIPLPSHKHKKRRKGGEHRRMKIPMSALKKDSAKNDKSGKRKKMPGMRFGMMKGKKAKNDNDGDEY